MLIINFPMKVEIDDLNRIGTRQNQVDRIHVVQTQ